MAMGISCSVTHRKLVFGCSSCAHLFDDLPTYAFPPFLCVPGHSEDPSLLSHFSHVKLTSSAHMALHACIFACSSAASFLMTCIFRKKLNVSLYA